MLRSIKDFFNRIVWLLKKPFQRKSREKSYLSQRGYLRSNTQLRKSSRRKSYHKNFFQRLFAKKVYLYSSIGAVVIIAAIAALLIAGVFTPSSDTMAVKSPAPSGISSPVETGMQSPTGTADGTEPSDSPTLSPSPTPTPTPTPDPINLDAMIKKFFNVKADKYYNDIGFSSNTFNFTEDDVYVMAQVIYKEAKGEPYTGKLAVGNVIMNRVLLRNYFGDTVQAVCKAPGQFAYYPDTKPDASCKRAARDVLAYEKWVIPQDVYYFKVASTNADWGSHKYIMRIGHHAFYEQNYPGRFHGPQKPDALFKRVYEWPTFGCKPGSRVKIVQRLLRSFSYKAVKTDGYFGKDMKDAIKDFQQKWGLDNDGICGPGTLKAMIKKYGVQKFAKDFGYKS